MWDSLYGNVWGTVGANSVRPRSLALPQNSPGAHCAPLHPFIKSTVGRGLDPSLRFGGYVRLRGRIWNPPLRASKGSPGGELPRKRVRGVARICHPATPQSPLVTAPASRGAISRSNSITTPPSNCNNPVRRPQTKYKIYTSSTADVQNIHEYSHFWYNFAYFRFKRVTKTAYLLPM